MSVIAQLHPVESSASAKSNSLVSLDTEKCFMDDAVGCKGRKCERSTFYTSGRKYGCF